MGKKDRDDDDEPGDLARGMAGARIDPEARRQSVRTRSSTSASARTRTRSETIDPARIAEATAKVVESTAAPLRLAFDAQIGAEAKALSEERAENKRLRDENRAQRDEIRTLTEQFLKLGNQNGAAQEREHGARLEELRVKQWHETARHIADKAGPALPVAVKGLLGMVPSDLLGSLVGLVGGATSSTTASPGDAESTRAALARFAVRLTDQSEESQGILGLLEDHVGAEDWTLVLGALRGYAAAARASASGAAGAASSGAEARH